MPIISMAAPVVPSAYHAVPNAGGGGGEFERAEKIVLTLDLFELVGGGVPGQGLNQVFAHYSREVVLQDYPVEVLDDLLLRPLE